MKSPALTFAPLDLRLLAARSPALLIGAALLVLCALLLWRFDSTQPSASPPATLVAPNNEQPFRQSLLPANDLASAQQNLLDQAHALSLQVGRIDYTQEIDSHGQFTRARLQLPLSGRYGDLRQLIERLLQENPALAIRQLTIERPGGDAGEAGKSSNSPLQATLTVEFLLSEATP